MRRILLTLVAALGVLFLGFVGQAQADTSPAETADVSIAAVDCGNRMYSPDGGAMVCFNPTGEHMFVCDQEGRVAPSGRQLPGNLRCGGVVEAQL